MNSSNVTPTPTPKIEKIEKLEDNFSTRNVEIKYREHHSFVQVSPESIFLR